MEKQVIKCVGNREFHISQRTEENGELVVVVEIVMGNTGRLIATPLLTPREAAKMSEALLTASQL